MQTKIKFLGLAVLAFCFSCAPGAVAQGYQPNFYAAIDIPASPTIINASATSNITTTAITVRQGTGLAFFAYLSSTNASTATATLHFDVSYDGTNFTTGQPLKMGVTMNGTTGVRGYTNFPATVLSNVRKIKLSALQNAHTASLFVTNAVVSYSNQP